MPMFIERVAVHEFDPSEVISDQPPNVIFIRPKMDFATQKRVGAAGFSLGAAGKPNELDLAENLIAMLVYNIVGWAGPLFDGVPCTPENIRRLDPDQPVVEKAIEEITRRNTKAAPSPKSPTRPGGASAGVHGWVEQADSSAPQSATTTPRSPLLSAAIGRQSRSED
jgi:hypothetical protein